MKFLKTDLIAYQCKRCGRWSGKRLNNWRPDMAEAEEIALLKKIILKCPYCGRYLKLKKENEYGLSTRIVCVKSYKELEETIKTLNEKV